MTDILSRIDDTLTYHSAGNGHRVCSASGCGRSGKITRGMCKMHYQRWLKDTPAEARPPTRSFEDVIDKSDVDGCWPWLGWRDRKGYGRWNKTLAHRLSWEKANGPIPDGLWVLHHCDNPPCVRPEHLYVGSSLDNVRDCVERGRNHVPPRRTHCVRGHELTDDNIVIHKRADGSPNRRCRTCVNAWARYYARRRREAAARDRAEAVA